MARKRELTRTKLIDLQNAVRGAIGTARSRNNSKTQSAVGSRVAIRSVLQEAKRNLDTQQYANFIEWVGIQTRQQLPALQKVPYRFDEFGVVPKRPAESLEDELIFVCAQLAVAVEEINAFRSVADEFETAIWSGDFETASFALDMTEALCGQTLWLIEANIALKQISSGLEAQKKYAAIVRKQARRGLAAYFAYHISVRNEPTVTSGRFSEETNKMIDGTKFPEWVKVYLKYRIASQWPDTERGIASILQVEQGNTLPDLYETFIKVSQHLIAEGSGRFDELLRTELKKLSGIVDFRLDRIYFLLGMSAATDVNADCTSLDYLLAGKPAKSFKAAMRSLKQSPLDLGEICTAAAAVSLSNRSRRIRGNALVSRTIEQLANLITKGDEYERSYNELHKVCRNLGFLPSWAAITSICEFEGGPRSPNVIQVFRQKVLNSRTLDPRAAWLFLEIVSDATVAEIVKQAKNSLTQEVMLAVVQNRSVPGERLHTIVHRGLEAFRKVHDTGSPKDIDEFAFLLEEQVPRSVHITFALALIEVLLRQGDKALAIDVMAKEYVIEPAVKRALPISEFMYGETWRILKPFSHKLSVPIVLDLLWQESSADQIGTYRRFATQQFLQKNGFSRPSEITASTSRFDRAELIYFLQNLCVPSVLDMMPVFGSSQELDEERRKICEILCDLDPKRSEQYDKEILEISNSLILRSGLQIVDSSRIHVDTEAIKNWAIKEFDESFERYMELVKAGVGVAENFDVVLRHLLKDEVGSKVFFEYPESEADDVLVRMVSDLLEKFLFDTTDGLDSYLSKRIRHESLTGYLRSPVEQAHLITQRNSQNNEYEPNSFWLARCKDLDQNSISIIDFRLRRFSEEFDLLLVELKDKYFHIQSKEKPLGVFHVELQPHIIHIIRSVIQQESSLEGFVKSCFAVFWSLLGPSLNSARNLLQGEAKGRVTHSFDRLRAEVLPLFENCSAFGYLSMELGDASAKVQSELDSIAGWLNRREIQESSTKYTLKQGIDIAIESALKVFRAFEPNITLNIDSSDVFVGGGDLAVLSDIMRVVFGNVIEHGNAPKNPYVQIEATISEIEEILTLKFSTDVGPGVNCPESEKILEEIRKDIAIGSYKEKVRKEGRSGLRKLASIAYQSDRGRLEFGFEGDDQFRIEMDLSLVISKQILAA